ncbi:MAG: fibronectin type III domain-containing protein [Planctomycetes bacterium]|nr:fibronectin type III domain-containing protein [Planctomycetota bacterium]
MDPKLLALKVFDKVVLAGFAVWLVVAAMGMVKQPPELGLKDQLDKDLRSIGEHMKGTTVAAAADPGWRAKLEGQLGPGTVPAGKAAPTWVFHRRPGFLHNIFVERVTFRCKHGAPTDLSADASQRGQVVVRWKPSLENEYVLCTFELMRRTGETGDWSVIYTAGPGTTEFIDTKVAPRTAYFYKVLSVAEPDQEAAVVQRHGLKLKPEETRLESGEFGPVRTQRDIYVLPQSVTPVTEDDIIRDPNARATAQVRVYKWDPETSTFQNQVFNVRMEQPIGEKKKLRGGREFDFTTGAVLDDVRHEFRPHPTIPDHQQKVGVIRIRFADGSSEEFNDKDKPPELQ